MASDNGLITFLAHFPAIQSAIRVGDDGMRIQLQIPESEMDRALWLVSMRDKVLQITVQVADDGKDRTISRRKARQREQ
jgi:hypothetical protein